MVASAGCRMEIAYIDPETYSGIVNHKMRKDILRSLYRMALNGPVSKQELADELELNYHQLVYQLTNHLREFWTVVEEQKKRGTRMELIAPSKPHVIFISLGREQRIYVFDPLANLFGPLSKVGVRCDICSDAEAQKCLKFVNTGCSCGSASTTAERAILAANGRKVNQRPVDTAIICALRGIPVGQSCVIDIPCNTCAFLKRTIKIA
jgi:hypothetical protein